MAGEAAQDQLVVVEEHLFLMGRPPMAEALGFLTQQMVNGSPIDAGVLAADWRSANDHIRDLEKSEAGWADGGDAGLVPDEMTSLREQALADERFRRAYTFVPADILFVELDKVVVFQRHLNLGYANQLATRFAAGLSDEELFGACIPLQGSGPKVNGGQYSQNGYSFMSPSNDFRFLGAQLVEPANVTGLKTNGQPAAVIALSVGYGINCLAVVAAEGRLILSNGSHRAYALRKAGLTHVPAVVQRVSRREELPLLFTGEVEQRPDAYLSDPRPPLLKDYFDSRLIKSVPVPRKLREVRVQYGLEQVDVPV